MFTGIIEATASVLSVSQGTLTIERPKSFTDIHIGSSIAVSGVCLTIVELDAGSMRFDVVETTVQKSKLGKLAKGARVNLERALRADSRLDGHIVQGHIDGVGVLRECGQDASQTMQISLPSGCLDFVVLHGSITIDGVSLTAADLTGDVVTVALIPETLRSTTLGSLSVGDTVNIETDILLKHLHALPHRSSYHSV
jgi:riboflavin synthase